jgi:signal transduction histidine kinase
VDQAAQHLLQVINDILDLSKIEAGKMQLEHIEFSRDALLSGALAMVSEQARAKGLELVLDTDHLPRHMRATRSTWPRPSSTCWPTPSSSPIGAGCAWPAPCWPRPGIACS